MSFNIRSFDLIKDMPDVHNWWEDQGWPQVPLNHLSTDGWIGEINGKKAVAAWVYHTNSAFCLLEFIVVNPEIRRAERAEAISKFIDYMVEYTRGLNFKTMFLTVKNESLISRLEKKGFQVSDRGMSNLIGRL